MNLNDVWRVDDISLLWRPSNSCKKWTKKPPSYLYLQSLLRYGYTILRIFLKHTRQQLSTDLDIGIGCEFIWIPFPRITFCLCKVDKVAISGNQIRGIKPWLRCWLCLMLIFVIWFIFTISMCSIFLLMNTLVYTIAGLVGCYVDKKDRVLTGGVTKSSSMTLATCRSRCQRENKKYYGLEVDVVAN